MKELSELEQWVTIALSDYDVALHLFNSMHPKPLEIICYHCQQCAEKALKGFLFYKKVNFPKTHDLSIICEMCIEQNSDFENFFAAAKSLTIYATRLRYPSEIGLHEHHAKKALENAKAIYDFCMTKIK